MPAEMTMLRVHSTFLENRPGTLLLRRTGKRWHGTRASIDVDEQGSFQVTRFSPDERVRLKSGPGEKEKEDGNQGTLSDSIQAEDSKAHSALCGRPA